MDSSPPTDCKKEAAKLKKKMALSSSPTEDKKETAKLKKKMALSSSSTEVKKETSINKDEIPYVMIACKDEQKSTHRTQILELDLNETKVKFTEN